MNVDAACIDLSIPNLYLVREKREKIYIYIDKTDRHLISYLVYLRKNSSYLVLLVFLL